MKKKYEKEIEDLKAEAKKVKSANQRNFFLTLLASLANFGGTVGRIVLGL